MLNLSLVGSAPPDAKLDAFLAQHKVNIYWFRWTSVLFRIFLSFRSSSTFLKWIVYQMMVAVLTSQKELHHQKSWLPSAESTLISRITLRSTWNMLANCLQMTSVIGFWYVSFVFTHSLLRVHISLIQKQYVGEVNPAFIRALANAVLESSMRVNLFW